MEVAEAVWDEVSPLIPPEDHSGARERLLDIVLLHHDAGISDVGELHQLVLEHFRRTYEIE